MALTRKTAPKYIWAIARAIGLGHWKITISPEPPECDNALAEVDYVPGRNCATIWLSHHFFACDEHEQRYAVLHELLHIHFAHSDTIAEKCLREGMYEPWLLAMEYSVDSVASVFAASLPLPK